MENEESILTKPVQFLLILNVNSQKKSDMVQAKAKIFLAEDRGLNETAWFRSFNTFNYGLYQQEHKQPFGKMYVLNDDALDGGRSMTMQVEEQSSIILLPVFGALRFKTSAGHEGTLAAGQVQLLMLDKGDHLELINPFKEELINFLQIWIRHDLPAGTVSVSSDFDVNVFQNSLLKISPQWLGDHRLPFSISIGKFSGRGEAAFYPSTPDAGVFMLVLDGAFEVAGRLLHARDGLALYETSPIDIEALSYEALILVVEQPALIV